MNYYVFNINIIFERLFLEFQFSELVFKSRRSGKLTNDIDKEMDPTHSSFKNQFTSKLLQFVVNSKSVNLLKRTKHFRIRIWVQVSLVIRVRYVPSFWTTNLEFADKNPFLTGQLSFWNIFSMWISKFTEKSPRITRVACTC